MFEFQIIGAYDRRTMTGTIAAPDAHAMVKASRKQSEPKDITRKAAEKLAADHGMVLLGGKPWLKLQKIGAKRSEVVNTAPYGLTRFKDVELFLAQLPLQEQQAELAKLSNTEIASQATKALELIF